MRDITLYTTPFCGYCSAAKRLLGKKGAQFTEICLFRSPEKRAEMVTRSKGSRTVPQIFIGERYIGGFDDLYDLEQGGDLDPLLTG